MQQKQTGVTVWFTGMSGSGKTTLSNLVNEWLIQRGYQTEVIDGDVLRSSLCRDLGFTSEDRFKNIERAAYICQLLTKHNIITLASFITPYQAMRDFTRQHIDSYLEIYVEAPLHVLIQRDTKGLYKKAISGTITDFTGIQDPYEAPNHSDLTLHTNENSPAYCANQVIQLLNNKGHIIVTP